MSSNPGFSTEAALAVTSASRRSPATTSSISLTDRSWPTARGVIESGKTTVSLSGRTGSVAGNDRSSGSGASVSTSSDTSLIGGSPVGRSRVLLPHVDRDLHGPGRLRRDGQHDRQEAPVVGRPRSRRIDRLGERDVPLERAVLDLGVLEDLAVDPWPAALSGDQQVPLARVDLHAADVDAGHV